MADDLSKLTRDELNAKADELGLEGAADFPNKAELIAAMEALAGADPDGESDDSDPDDQEPEDAEGDEPAEGTPYRVLKAITVDTGQTFMPGDEIVIDASWPARRAKQLVEQKFLAPMGDAS